MKKLLLSNFFVLLIFQQVLAQETMLTASASRSQVAVGEQFQITYTLNGGGGNFHPPEIRDFSLLSGPNQSSSMSYVNGSMSQSISISYILSAQREGKFTIGPASIVVNGKTVSSKSLTIEVVKNPSSNQQRATQGRSQESGADNSDVFLRASIDKSKVYVGEQLTVVFKVYTKVNIVDNAISKATVYNGFWSEDVPNQQASLHPEVIDGVQYQVAEIKRSILMPQRSGNLEITEMSMDYVKRVQRSAGNSFFDQFFGGGFQDVRGTAKSKTLKIEVIPLPTAGKPADFSGAVGDFGIESRLSSSSKKLKTNDATNLYISISGKGNLKLIDPFALKLPDGIESYDPKINDKISTTSAGVSGSRTFDYLLIPRHSGSYTIPSMSFTYFDISQKSYVTLSTPEFPLEVEKGAANESEATVSISSSKEEVKVLGNDIRFIKTKTNLIQSNNRFFKSVLYYFLLLLPALLFLIFHFVYKQYLEKQKDVSGIKSKKATKVARKRLEQASIHLQANNYDAFYNELFKSINGYLSDKLNIALADLSKQNIVDSLQKKGADNTAVNFLMDTLNKSEFARFSPTKDTEDMQTDYNNTVATITNIEDQLK